MSDPRRLTDPRSKSPRLLRRLIEAGQSDVPETERLGGIAERLGFGIGGVPGTTGAVKAAATGVGASAAKIGAAALVVLGAGAGALTAIHTLKMPLTVAAAPSARFNTIAPIEPWVTPPVLSRETRSSAPPEARAAPVASASIARAASSMAAVGTQGEGPSAAATSSPLAGLPVTSRGDGVLALPPDRPSTDTEFSLLEQAQRAMHSDPGRALDLADLDAQSHPTGALAQEREVIAIEALARLGRGGEAGARATRFLHAFPGSAHGPRIASILDFDAGHHNP